MKDSILQNLIAEIDFITQNERNDSGSILHVFFVQVTTKRIYFST